MKSASKDSIGAISGILIGILVFCLCSLHYANFKPEEFGLGLNTIKRIARHNDLPLSSIWKPDSIQLAHFAKLQGEGQKITLWLGASQLHSINKFEEGNMLAVEYANERVNARSSNAVNLQASTPNAGLHDILVMYQIFRQEKLFPDWLVIAMVYDDLKETDIQLGLLKSLRNISEETLKIGEQGIRNVNKEKLIAAQLPAKKTPLKRNAVVGTPQEYLENELISTLDEHFPGYQHRGKVVAKIDIGFRIYLPKILSGIVQQPREPEVPEHQKTWSNLALESLLKLALHDGCKVLLYKQPHPPTAGEFYYNRKKYDAYFEELAQKCEGTDGLYYIDLETIVPPDYWGLTNSGRPDVFHFTDRGHELLGNSIDDFFSELIIDSDSVIQ